MESGISHNDADALQDHCVESINSQGREGTLRQKKDSKKEEKKNIHSQ